MTMSRNSVLVCEDEPLIRLALAAALEDEGYVVHEAGSVLQAVAVLAKHEIDAVVTDVDMPGGLSGLDLVEMLTGLSRTRAIVVVSGRAISSATLPQGVDFVAKPYSLESIIELVEGRLLSSGFAVAV